MLPLHEEVGTKQIPAAGARPESSDIAFVAYREVIT
jgi:hypothetical protein